MNKCNLIGRPICNVCFEYLENNYFRYLSKDVAIDKVILSDESHTLVCECLSLEQKSGLENLLVNISGIKKKKKQGRCNKKRFLATKILFVLVLLLLIYLYWDLISFIHIKFGFDFGDWYHVFVVDY